MTCNSRITKIFPGLAGISIGKLPSGEPKTLRQPLFAGPYLSSPSSISHKSGTLRNKVSQAFQRYQDRLNMTSGATSTMHAKTDENREKTLKIWRVFPPGHLPSCADSFQIAVSWSTSLEPWEILQLQLPEATLGSLVESPVWPESSPKKREKTARTTRLPGAITFPFELRFAQNLYCWKLDFSSFPTVLYMTHFEHHKASKSFPENWVRKLYRRTNRGRFAEGAAWQIRSPRGSCTRGVASPCAAHHEGAPHVWRITKLCEFRL